MVFSHRCKHNFKSAQPNRVYLEWSNVKSRQSVGLCRKNVPKRAEEVVIQITFFPAMEFSPAALPPGRKRLHPSV
jgi:hypothetical protein